MFIQMYEEKYMRFPEGKAKALTFSYDDGVEADKRLLQLFDSYGLKGTFNLNSLLFDCREWHRRMDEGETFSTFIDCQHEVAMHGARHAFLNKLPLPEAVNELVQNRVYLENKFNRIVRGLAYAYGAYSDEILNILPSLGIAYARTTESTHSFSLPQNFLKWHPTCHHGDSRLFELAEKFNTYSPNDQTKHREPLLFFVWGHSFEFEEAGNWQIIEDFAETVGGKKDVWYATNVQIYDYVQAYRSLVFSIDGERAHNPSAIPVWIEVRGKVYKIEPSQTLCFAK